MKLVVNPPTPCRFSAPKGTIDDRPSGAGLIGGAVDESTRRCRAQDDGWAAARCAAASLRFAFLKSKTIFLE